MQAHVVTDGTNKNVVVFHNGAMLVADHNHPNIAPILKAIEEDNDSNIEALFDASVVFIDKFKDVTDMITVGGGNVFINGDPIDDVYGDLLLQYLNDGINDWKAKAIANFLDKVYTNPDAEVRKHLSRWVKAAGTFTIDTDGDIRGYKGLNKDFSAIHAGPGIVNGTPIDDNGHLDNSPGNVVSIARSKVVVDPRNGCAFGLHVGTWSYASGFGRGQIVEVKVNPRDVVSVPTDCSDRKMRVSKYKVIRKVTGPYSELIVK